MDFPTSYFLFQFFKIPTSLFPSYAVYAVTNYWWLGCYFSFTIPLILGLHIHILQKLKNSNSNENILSFTTQIILFDRSLTQNIYRTTAKSTYYIYIFLSKAGISRRLRKQQKLQDWLKKNKHLWWRIKSLGAPYEVGLTLNQL